MINLERVREHLERHYTFTNKHRDNEDALQDLNIYLKEVAAREKELVFMTERYNKAVEKQKCFYTELVTLREAVRVYLNAPLGSGLIAQAGARLRQLIEEKP